MDSLVIPWDSLAAQMVKNLPSMRETWIQSLGQEDPLEKEMATHSQEIATHSTVLAWRISWTEEPCGLHFMGFQRVRHNWATNTHTYKYLNLLLII